MIVNREPGEFANAPSLARVHCGGIAAT